MEAELSTLAYFREGRKVTGAMSWENEALWDTETEKASSASEKGRPDVPPESQPSSHLPPSLDCVSCAARWVSTGSDPVFQHLEALAPQPTLARGRTTRA